MFVVDLCTYATQIKKKLHLFFCVESAQCIVATFGTDNLIGVISFNVGRKFFFLQLISVTTQADNQLLG